MCNLLGLAGIFRSCSERAQPRASAPRGLDTVPTHWARTCSWPGRAVRWGRTPREGEPALTTPADGVGPFAVLLQRYRQAAGLSQEELAERAGLSARGISDLERGVRRSPYPVTVRALAKALGLDATAQTRLLAAVRPRSGVPEARG